MGGGGHVFFANYTLILSYIFIKTNPIFLFTWSEQSFSGLGLVLIVRTGRRVKIWLWFHSMCTNTCFIVSSLKNDNLF